MAISEINLQALDVHGDRLLSIPSWDSIPDGAMIRKKDDNTLEVGTLAEFVADEVTVIADGDHDVVNTAGDTITLSTESGLVTGFSITLV